MSSTLKFAGYTLHPNLGELYGEEGQVRLEPKAIAVLQVLIEAQGAVLTRESIINQVWPNQIISDDALNNCVSKIRKALSSTGKQASLLETVPRKGYRLQQPTIESEPVAEREKKRLPPALLWPLSALLFITLASLAFSWQQGWQAQRQLRQDVLALHEQQKISFESFILQVRRRDELTRELTQRLGIEKQQEFEQFFRSYYPLLNEREKLIFDQIRGITSGLLYPANQRMLDIANSNPDIAATFPLTEDLRKHLIFWLNKYQTVFLQRDDMALLYVGVEDAVPYPSELDRQVRTWLEERQLIPAQHSPQ